MNFINPYIEIYFQTQNLATENDLPFSREIYWTFLKHLDSRLGLRQHRLNIVFTDKVIEEETIMRFASIFEYQKQLDRPLNKQSEADQRMMLLDIIYEAFIAVGSKFNWDIEIIKDAYQKSIPEINKFEYISAPKNNRSRNLSGQIKLELTGRELNISAIITDNKNKKTKRFSLLKTDEDNFSWERNIKKFGWYDNQKFGLKFISGDLWILINLENENIEDLKRPQKASKEKIEKYLQELKTLPTTV